MNTIKLLILFQAAAVLVIAVLTSRKSIVFSLRLLSRAGCTLHNYRGSQVTFGMGIAFIPVLIMSIIPAMLLFRNQYLNYMTYLFAVCVIGFAGIIDDFIGDKQVKGLKNHAASFLSGRLTTGFLKAFLGLAASMVIALGISTAFTDFAVNVLIMALFTNALNLMDLRPGRCVKIFLLIGFALIALNLDSLVLLLPLMILLAAAMVYMGYDLKELCMLGDTGSNILGMTLGYFSALVFSTPGKLAVLAALLTLNLAAERISITKIISGSRLLSYLDNLGRSGG